MTVGEHLATEQNSQASGDKAEVKGVNTENKQYMSGGWTLL